MFFCSSVIVSVTFIASCAVTNTIDALLFLDLAVGKTSLLNFINVFAISVAGLLFWLISASLFVRANELSKYEFSPFCASINLSIAPSTDINLISTNLFVKSIFMLESLNS